MPTKPRPPKIARKKREPGVSPYNEPMSAPELAYRLAAEGLLRQQIAEVFGVDAATMRRWVRVHPEFASALQAGCDEFDSQEAERSLLRRVKGYSYIEKHYERVPVETVDEEGKTRKTLGKTLELVKTVKKAVAPDPTSIFFWLCNRAKDRWKHQRELVGSLKFEDNRQIAAPEKFLAEYLAARDHLEAEAKATAGGVSKDQAVPGNGKTGKNGGKKLADLPMDVESLLAPPEFMRRDGGNDGKTND